MWNKTKKALQKVFQKPDPKIQIFVRHCFYSEASAHKKRFSGFSYEGCYQNLLAVTDFSRAELTLIYDRAKGARQGHFLQKESNFPVEEIEAGTEAASFLAMLEIVQKKRFSPETICYFVEDDYLHRPGWQDVLLEAFSLPEVDYVTLYDHKDKYQNYPDLLSKVFVGSTCHFRTTPSTTNTFAMRYQTLLNDLSVHESYSTGISITKDHEKFCALKEKGRTLVSSIPGFSTHVDVELFSPCIDWSIYTGVNSKF